MKIRLNAILAVTSLFCLTASLHAEWMPGLQGGTVSSSVMNTTAYPATTNVYMGPHAGKTTASPPWADNTLCVYWGQIYLEASTIWFAEKIDDAVNVRIWEGDIATVVLTDDRVAIPSAGSFVASSAGWYPVEIRLWNGGGGAGPTTGMGWTSTHGFGYKIGGASSLEGSDYLYPEDDGEMSIFRYDDGLGFRDTLFIQGDPVAYGTASPHYGQTNGLNHGDTFVCGAPEETVAVDEGVRVHCSGYVLTTNNNQVVASGTGTTYSYTHSTNASENILTWQWASEFAIKVDATAGGSATAIDDWYSDGTSLTITATPDSGYRFLRWQGDTMPGGGEVFNASTTILATRPRHVTALFIPDVAGLTAKVYTSTNSGRWEVAENWSPAGVPTINDAVVITNRRVKVRAEAVVGSLEVIDGGLYVAGSGIVAGSQQAADFVRSDPVGLLVATDLHLTGFLSIGGTGQQCPSYLTVGGDLTLDNGRQVVVYAGPGEDDAWVTGGAVISVAGTTTIGEGSWIVPDANLRTGAPVICDLQHLVVARAGGFDATQRGYGWINMGTNVPPEGMTYEQEVADYWCTLAPGAGYEYSIGGGYGGRGGSFSSTRGRSYGNYLAPIQPGSPNGVFKISDWRRGGGAVRIHSRDILLEGQIKANAGPQTSFGGSSGGGIWITCDTITYGVEARLQAEGGNNYNYSSSGGGGRIAVAQGLGVDKLDALMMGQAPTGVMVTNIEMVTTSAIGGLSSIRAESGTVVLTRSADSSKTLDVSGLPVRAGTPLIPYGQTAFEHGQWVTNSVDEYSVDSATGGIVRYRCAGYTISNSTGFVESGSGVSVEVKMDADNWLTWNWVEPESRFLVQADVNGTLQVGAATENSFLYWLESGASPFTVTALPDSGYHFLCWEGDVPLGETFNATIEVPIRFHPRTLTARFAEDSPSFSPKRYVGLNNGAWETAANWEPTGEPTAADAVYITNRNVFVSAEAVAGRLVLSGGALIVGGSTTTVTSQQPSDLARTEPVGLRVVGDAWLAGNVSMGGLYQLGTSYLNVGGDLTLTDAKSLAVYAGPSTGPAPIKLGGARVTVAGMTTLSGNSWIYPDCDRYTGHPVLFDLRGLSIDASSGFNATQRGYGWVYYGSYPPPVGLAFETAAYQQEGVTLYNNYWVSVAPGIGESFTKGGGYGGRGGSFSATRGLSYGSAYAPFYPGSPNGIYNGGFEANSRRGGGAIRISASDVTLAGKLLAEAGSQSIYGGSSGGGIWLVCDRVEFPATAYLSVEGGNNQAYTSSGGGGRVSVAIGLDAADLEALANEELPSGLVYEPLDQVVVNTLGGRASLTGEATYWMAESGTATLVTATDSPKFLQVLGSPLEAGVTEPFYGTHTYANAQEVDVSAPLAGLNPTLSTQRFTCQGYVLSNATEEVASGTGTELTLTMSENLFLTWLWDAPEIRYLAEASAGGLIAVGVKPPSSGTSIWMAVDAMTPFITAVPNAGYEFLYWLGEVPYGMATNNPLRFAADVPRNVTALFRLAEPRTTRTWNGGTTPGNWHDASLWLPAGNLPGLRDDVIIDKNYCLVSNYVEVGSLTLANAAIVRVAASTAAINKGQGVHTIYHLPLSNVKIEEARVVVRDDLTMSGTSQMGVGGNNQTYAASLDVGGDLWLTGTNRFAIFGGPTNALLNHMTGTAQVRVGGQMRLDLGSWVYPGSDGYTGGSVRFDLNTLIVATNAGFNATGLGFDWFISRDPVTLAPGKGYDYYRGGGYGGRGGSYDTTYGKTYGFLKAPWLPGSCNGKYQPPIRGGGLIRIHANRAILDGSLLADSPTTSWAGGPSGGGIWVTASKILKIGPKVVMSVKGGPSNYASRGGGGGIAIGLQFTEADIESPENLTYPYNFIAVFSRDRTQPPTL